MRCEELMKTRVETVRPRDTVQDCARIMRDRGIGFLPVCDADRRVLGTITDRDIVVRCVAHEGPIANLAVEDCMTREVVACAPDDDIEACEQLMANHRKSRIMICDQDDRLVGVISLSDVAQHDRSRRAGKTLRKVTTRETQTASR